MSSDMCRSCESDEPVTRLKDIGRPKPPRRRSSRHVVNPNFMFFCQIVLLVIPISVLYAGLYFMNISSSVVVLICGAIIFLILCIFIFVKPFKEEKCDEHKSPGRSYEYSPIKTSTDTEPMKKERHKPEKRHVRRDDDDGDDEEEDECASLIKHASTDTILSIATSEPSGLLSQTATELPITKLVTSTDDRVGCYQMGCRGRGLTSKENEGVQEDLQKSKLVSSKNKEFEISRTSKQLLLPRNGEDEYTWETRGALQSDKISHSLSIINEEEVTEKPDSLDLPSSEKTYSQNSNTAKLLIPDVALSDSTNPSLPTTMNNLQDTPCTTDYRHECLSQSNRRAIPGFGTQQSSNSASDQKISPSSSPKKSRSPRKFVKQIFTEPTSLDSEPYNLPSFPSGTHTEDAACNRVCSYVSKNEDKPNSQHGPPTSITSTIPDMVTQPMSRNYGQDVNQTSCQSRIDLAPVCTNRFGPIHVCDMPCSGKVRNHKTNQMKLAQSKNKKGFLEDSQVEAEKLAAHGEQNIFADQSLKDKEPGSMPVQFRLCSGEQANTRDQCSSTDHKRTKQPILIKLFPTSSKDGVFSWEANPVRPSGFESSPKSPSVANKPQFEKTVDECVQTSTLDMVDTQTSAVFLPRERTVHYSPEVEDSNPPQEDLSRRNTSGSLVDFVLRPFAVHGKPPKTMDDKKPRNDKMKSSRKSKQDESYRPREATKTIKDSSQFDLLEMQNSFKKGRRKSPEKCPQEGKPASPNKRGKSPGQCKNAGLDICSIYYSGIQNKLYQPTRSGLLVTESSKEDVDKPQQVVKRLKTDNIELEHSDQFKTKISPRQRRCETIQKQPAQEVRSETRPLTRTKRKNDEESKSKRKSAKYDELDAGRLTKNDEMSLPWQNTIGNIKKPHVDERASFMFPPLSLDFSSGPYDENSKTSSLNPPEKPICTNFTDCRVPNSSGTCTMKDQRISNDLESATRKSSMAYEDELTEKVVKHKKRTLKKFK